MRRSTKESTVGLMMLGSWPIKDVGVEVKCVKGLVEDQHSRQVTRTRFKTVIRTTCEFGLDPGSRDV